MRFPACRVPSQLERLACRGIAIVMAYPAGPTPAEPLHRISMAISEPEGLPFLLLPASDQWRVLSITHPCFYLLLLLPHINSIFFLFPTDLMKTIL